MPGVFQHTFNVTQEAVDANGHVNNLEYMRWMLDAAVMHSDRQGCTRKLKAIGATWIVRSHSIEYFHPAFAGDEVAVLTWVSNFRKVRSFRKYKVIRIDDNKLLARAETKWVFLDVETGRPRSIPREITELFELVPVSQEP